MRTTESNVWEDVCACGVYSRGVAAKVNYSTWFSLLGFGLYTRTLFLKTIVKGASRLQPRWDSCPVCTPICSIQSALYYIIGMQRISGGMYRTAAAYQASVDPPLGTQQRRRSRGHRIDHCGLLYRRVRHHAPPHDDLQQRGRQRQSCSRPKHVAGAFVELLEALCSLLTWPR